MRIFNILLIYHFLNKKVCISDREKLANILDIRTVGAKHMTANRSLFRECSSLLLDEYFNFGLKSNKWEATKKKEIKDTTNK